MPNLFWVIGGEYRDANFENLVDGTARVLGPYRNYTEANHVWRERSFESRRFANVRYAIVSAAGKPESQQQQQAA